MKAWDPYEPPPDTRADAFFLGTIIGLLAGATLGLLLM